MELRFRASNLRDQRAGQSGRIEGRSASVDDVSGRIPLIGVAARRCAMRSYRLFIAVVSCAFLTAFLRADCANDQDHRSSKTSGLPITDFTISGTQTLSSDEIANLHGKQTGARPADEQATSAQAGVPVSMVVTVQGHHGSEQPNISAENVIVNDGGARAEVTEWVPLQGDRAGLELFILLDESMSTNRGTQLEDVQHFIMAQPVTTKIGVAYMQEGGTKIVQSLTSDHSLASIALHVTLGELAGAASPYVALEDLIKRWPGGKDRREIIMISKGVDLLFGQRADKDNIYLDSAVAEAQRAGIIVFTINSSRVEGPAPGPPPEPRRPDPISSQDVLTGWSRNYLSEVADQTGGVSYYQESGTPISFAPYLEDATRRLNRQYQLTFLAKPEKKAGLQAVKVKVERPQAEVTRAERVYVPATR
jgi:hypothetical protein